MVGKTLQMTPISTEELTARLRRAYPELEAVAAASEDPVFLAGGGVRDLLLGLGRCANLDLVVEGDAADLGSRIGEDLRAHERFATATVRLGDLEVDIAAARTESYAAPGALPEVTSGADLESDLGRRDFTINAMAVPLAEPRLIDPHGGEADLEAHLLRVLHPASFVDDPTRALRAARYAARLTLALEPETERLLRAADLDTVSADRREADLLRLAAEARAPRGFELLAQWGLVEPRAGGVELAERVATLLSSPPWEGFARRDRALLAAALAPPGAEAELASQRPASPSDAVRLAAHHDPPELVLARALGAEWLDRYLTEWRAVSLEIGGEDLIEAGVPEGPAVGRGLAAALRMKLDGELGPGRSEELAAAVAAAGSDDGVA